jgi:predicted nucleotidyltransferase
MKKLMSPEEIAEKLIPLFREKDLELVLLVGSIARDKTHERSDIDLAFLYHSPIDILKLTNKLISLLHTDNIDVIDLRRANPLLQYSSVKNSIVLYEKSPGIFSKFYSFAFRRYIDTKKLRAAQEKYIKQVLKERGLI